MDVPAEIRRAHFLATKKRLADLSFVLAVQDTTSLDLTHHPGTDHLGPLENTYRQGLFVHSTLAVTLDGTPLGLLAQQDWARDPAQTGKRHRRKTTAIAGKESRKWLDALHESASDLPEGVTLLHVGDRESDIYDLFLLAKRMPQVELLVRASWDRKVESPEGYLWAHLEALPIADHRQIEVPRSDERPTRKADLTLRWGTITLCPPSHRKHERLPQMTMQAVLVREEGPPAGSKALEWLLLTTLPIENLATAWEMVTWYRYRWRVERYHLVLKSGCRIEERQLETAERMSCCLALYAVIASRLLSLTYQARKFPDTSGLVWISREEWALVWTTRYPQKPIPPEPTVRQVVREIAGLGGFLGRRHDGEPGVIVLWRGLQRLNDLLSGYHAAFRLSKLVGNA